MITIESPNMALNDSRISRTYQMDNTWPVQTTDTKDHIINWVAAVAGGGKLKNLVLNCHGNAGFMQMGAGFARSDTDLFAGWRGLVDKIWITGCRVGFINSAGGNDDGNLFCSAIAKAAGCYLVVSTETQWFIGNTLYPKGKIDSFEGLVLSYGPGGDVTWSHRYSSNWADNKE